MEYTTFGERLHKLGFTEDLSEAAPICRWQHGQIKLDLMPLDETILGFSNRWHNSAMDSAQEFEIEREHSHSRQLLGTTTGLKVR